MLRQALERGCDRSDVIEVLGVSRRTTFNKQRRACAYDFPLDAFRRGGRPADSSRSDTPSVTSEITKKDSDEQQRLDAVADQGPESEGETETAAGTGRESNSHAVDEKQEHSGQSANSANEELHARLQRAINALQEVDNAL